MRIIDHRQAGPDAVYVETFNECYYDADAEGNVDVVLRREHVKTDDPSQTVTQIIHVRSFWKSIPGTTVAHDQQINATVRYMILSGRAGASFQGAGSIFCEKTRGRSVLEGDLGLAYLSPRTRLNNGNMLFERAEISGSFRARHDPRRVVRILNEMDELFRFSEPGDAHASRAQTPGARASAVQP
ncbi:MAG: hypothetical protein IT449_14055 [Phycisphaerales bacterium]|nr:hypothetical protein [Phycisphaerales bacterium]